MPPLNRSLHKTWTAKWSSVPQPQHTSLTKALLSLISWPLLCFLKASRCSGFDFNGTTVSPLDSSYRLHGVLCAPPQSLLGTKMRYPLRKRAVLCWGIHRSTIGGMILITGNGRIWRKGFFETSSLSYLVLKRFFTLKGQSLNPIPFTIYI